MSKIITTQIDGVSYQVLRRTFRPKKKGSNRMEKIPP
jgi:hypothetical protein